MGNFVLGAQLFTLRDHLKTNEDFELSMKKLSDIGYKYFHASGVGGDVSEETICRAVKENGQHIVLTHTATKSVCEDPDKQIERHIKLGCEAIGVPGTGYPQSYDGYMQFCEDISKPVEKAKQANLKFCLHNHFCEFEKYNGKYAIEHVLENTDPETVMLTFDVYWAYHAGVDAAEFIHKYGSRIFCTHMKDTAVIDGKNRMIELLDGNLNYDKVMKEIYDAGIKWHFVEQDNVFMDAFESVKISRDNMKKRFEFLE